MVATATPRNLHYRLEPANIDPTAPLQEAFNLSERKQFVIEKTTLIRHPRTGRKLREFMIRDNYQNPWVTYLAVCADLETHQWPTDKDAYIKPSIRTAHGGLTQDLFDHYRDTAFAVFDRQDKAIRALRSLASQTAGKIIADVSKLDIPPEPKLRPARKAGGQQITDAQ